jgi:mannosyl-3-phosphoglycerate phosphatase
LRTALARRNISMISGARFTSVSAANDKGRAAKMLAEMFRRERGQVTTVGIGDSWNDAPLLAVMDIPLLVQRPGGTWASLPVNGIHRINGVGPKGWSQAMQTLVGSGFGNG